LLSLVDGDPELTLEIVVIAEESKRIAFGADLAGCSSPPHLWLPITHPDSRNIADKAPLIIFPNKSSFSYVTYVRIGVY
jgi:hypothetical protein